MNETLFMIGSFITTTVFFIVFFILLALKIYIGAGVLIALFFLVGCFVSCYRDKKDSRQGNNVEMSVHYVKDIRIVPNGETKQNDV
jgi:hypothetical protein